MLDKIKNIKVEDKTKVKIILLIIFLSMLVLNFLTPLIADDYSYALNLKHTRVSSISDIIGFQANHYMHWGGRSVAHSIAQFFMIFPKWLFNICNSLIYTAIIYLIYNFAKEKNKDRPYLLLAIHFMIYFISPVFGQNCIWLIGSCNYIWTMAIMLALLYQYKNNYTKEDNIMRIILMFILGIISGWTNENTSFGLLVIIISMIVLNKLNNKKINKWHISGALGNLLGFAIMILAPGNFVRSAGFVDKDFIIIRWIKRFITCTLGIFNYCMPLVIALIILFTIYIYNRKKINNYVYIFILGSIFSIYPMVLSPEFPERSWFGVIIFLIISILILLYEIEDINKIFKPIIYDTLIITTLFFIPDYKNLLIDINALRGVWNYRINYIEKHKEDEKIRLSKYSSNNKKSPNYALADLSDEGDGWPNQDIGRYYGVENKIEGYVEE